MHFSIAVIIIMKNIFILIIMNQNAQAESNIDKIDIEDLIKDFRLLNLDKFTGYLKDIWRVYFYFI